jgi:HEAT repeat protein
MSDLDDLPDVPDVPEDEPAKGGLSLGNDEEAVRQIRRRVSPMGWLLIVSVLGVGGATGYYLVQSAREEERQDQQTAEGRRALAALIAQVDLTPEETARRLRDLYTRYPNAGVRLPVRRMLAALRDPQALPMLIDGLRETGRTRAEAALGIAELGLPAAEGARSALLAALPLTDPQVDQVDVAWALVVLQEPRVWDTVQRLLGTNKLQDVTGLDGRRLFDRALVARLAGRERLLQLAVSTNGPSRHLAALSLAELATPDVVDALAVLSRDPQAATAREAAIGLGRTGDRRAEDPIVAFLNTHRGERNGILSALAQSSGARGLGVVIHAARDPELRQIAAHELREVHDPDAGDALAEVLQGATGTDPGVVQTRRDAIFGLAEIGDARAVDGLVEIARYATMPEHQDPNSTQDAKLALDQIRKIPGAAARARPALLEFVHSPRGDFFRTGVLLALAQAGDPSVGSQLVPFLAQVDAQEGAAVAVCALRNADGMGRVRTQLRRPPGLNMAEETVRDEAVLISRRNAIRGIAWSGNDQVSADLFRIIDDPQDRRSLREEAGFALAAVASEATVEQIATRAMDTTRSAEARLYYVWALRGRSTPQIAVRLVQTYLRPGVNPDLMKAAAIAAGLGADETLSDQLVPLLGAGTQDPNVRFAAAVATVLGGNARAARALVDVLVDNDELVGTLQNEFSPRGMNPNAATAQENWLLLPITRPMLTDGRIFRRVETAGILEQARAGKHFTWAQAQLTGRLRSGWEHVLGIGPYEIRSLLRETALGTDSRRRDMAFRALRLLNDRGSLLSLRRQTRVPEAAERARQELVAMSGPTS